MGGAIQVRNEYQALFALKGKILNTQNASDTDILANEELSMLNYVMTGKKDSMGNKFNLKDMKYHKIISKEELIQLAIDKKEKQIAVLKVSNGEIQYNYDFNEKTSILAVDEYSPTMPEVCKMQEDEFDRIIKDERKRQKNFMADRRAIVQPFNRRNPARRSPKRFRSAESGSRQRYFYIFHRKEISTH